MFSKFAFLAAAVVPLASALTLNIPTGPTSGGNVTITWTSAPNDPATFSLELVNTAFHNSFAIANNVNPTAGTVSLTLPIVPVGDGYSLEAVDIGNITNIFDATGDFSIGAVTVSITPSSTSSSTSSASHGSTSVSASVTPVTTASGLSTAQTGLSTNVVSPSSTAPGSTSTSALPTTSNFSSAVSYRFSLGNSAGGIAAVVLSAIAGAVMLAF
ncbi:hypothetical protein CPB84DRAFT_1836171 [Gymnopilus junonius]|uniref:Yeast cell wall synthesis Kre9/Knh1-like N-terminal domain-containing protein n=1 Tax=Gymnopilus junonius TaxID=109634 RepID=A0A9P5NMG1_GYMJU|nr:hypothetical protein CPB84DRAFT_1836171 [Gymnopilus junonius]